MSMLNSNSDKTGEIVTKGVLVSGIGNTVLRFLDLGIAVILLRWLSVFDYGVYRLTISAYEFFAGFFLAGLENVVVSDTAGSIESDPRKAKSLFSFYFYFLFIIGAFLWALFFWGSELISPWAGSGTKYLKIISLLFLLAPFETAYKLKFQIFLDFKWLSFYKVIIDIARIAIISASFFFLTFGVSEAIVSYVGAIFISMVFIFIFYRKESLMVIPAVNEIKNAAETLFLKHGKWALASDFMNNASQNIRPFVIKAFVGTEAVALISVAQNFIANIKSLFPIREILNPVLPRVTDNYERLSDQINKATKYSTIAYAIIGAGSAILVPIAVFLIFPKYLVSLPFFWAILVVSMLTSGFRSVALPVFYALKAQQTLFMVTTVRLFCLVVFSIIFTYFFGIWGVVIDLWLNSIIIVQAYAVALHKILPQWQFSWRAMFLFDDYDKIIISGIKNRILSKVRKIRIKV